MYGKKVWAKSLCPIAFCEKHIEFINFSFHIPIKCNSIQFVLSLYWMCSVTSVVLCEIRMQINDTNICRWHGTRCTFMERLCKSMTGVKTRKMVWSEFYIYDKIIKLPRVPNKNNIMQTTCWNCEDLTIWEPCLTVHWIFLIM